MKRALLAALILCLLVVVLAPAHAAAALLVASAPAQAAHRQHHKHWRHWSHHLHRHYVRVHNPRTGRGIRHVDFSYHTVWSKKSTLHGLMRVADSQGGHCGLWTEWALLRRVEHVLRDARGTWNPWLADDWSRHFPHVAPAPGTAAVWPHRHVAPVLAVNHDGTVTVRDSWAVHRVRMAGLVFVQPPHYYKRPENYNPKYNWPSVVPL